MRTPSASCQSIRREHLQQPGLLGSANLEQALKDFVAHYRIERPHQGLGNRVLTGSTVEIPKDADVVVDERLGGLLRSYRYSA